MTSSSSDGGHGPAAHDRPVTAPSPARGGLPPLLGPGDPSPVTVLNPQAVGPLLLVCDHASRAIPHSLENLGLPEEQLGRHIAYDIGAAALTRRLAERFSATAVLSGYSRLVIDPNRDLEDPTAIPVISDGVVIPGNRALDAAAQAQRVETLFRPYQDAVARQVARVRAGGQVPILLSVHSFTPEMRGVPRPWHIGVLWDRDPRLPVPLLNALRADGRWRVGDNEPYSGRGTTGGTVETHATPAGYPNALLEVRQDLIDDDAGVALWAQVLGDALERLLTAPDLATIHHYPRV